MAGSIGGPEELRMRDAVVTDSAELSYFTAPEPEAAVRGVKPSETSEPAASHGSPIIGSCCTTFNVETWAFNTFNTFKTTC